METAIDAGNTITGSVMTHLSDNPHVVVLLLDRHYRHHCRRHSMLPTLSVPLAQESYVSSNWHSFVGEHAGDEHACGAWTKLDDDGKRQAYVAGKDVQYVQCSGSRKVPTNGLAWKVRRNGEAQGELRVNDWVTFKSTGAHGQIMP